MQNNIMIKCIAIADFTLSKFNELIDIERKSIEQNGKIFKGDKFKCTKEMAEYLTGKNDKGNVVVKIIGVIPEKVIEK